MLVTIPYVFLKTDESRTPDIGGYANVRFFVS